MQAAWDERRYDTTVDNFVQQAMMAGVSGVPAMAWPNRRAIMGMRPADALVELLRGAEA